MAANTDSEKHKQKVTQTFNSIAQGYDNAALRFFPFTADYIVNLLKPIRGHKILDVATGTGAAAVALAQAIRPDGRVMAIDRSQAMLDKAEANARKMALTNIDLFDMDAEVLDFRRDYFDATVCSFGLFFMPHMDQALKEWVRVTKPGGTLLFTTFSESAFQPLRRMMIDLLKIYDVEIPNPMYASERLTDPIMCRTLMENAGLQDVRIINKQMGYHLSCADDWWTVLWNSRARDLLQLLDETQLAEYREIHLKQISELATDKGIWMDVEVMFVLGCVKA